MSEPIDHHYLPVFYLSRWAGADGRVCRYSQPTSKEVKAKRVVPKGTGFEPRLYETRGLPPERAQTMEKDFMAKLDTNAAKALAVLESGSPEKDWSPGLRTGWSRFMLTQMLRTPEDIAQLKSSVGQALGKAVPELEEVYAAQRSEGDPPTLLAYLEEQNPGQADEFALSVARHLIVPSGSIDEHGHVLVVGDRTGEPIEELLHRLGVGIRHDKSETVVGVGLDGCEDVGEREALVAQARRSLTPRPPDVTGPPLLSDPRLVLEEQAECACFYAYAEAFSEVAGLFLKAA